MSRPLLIDDCPSALVRAFSNKTYADAFLSQGRLRLSNIREFREIGDARQDETEGRAAFRVPGHIPAVAIEPHLGKCRILAINRAMFTLVKNLSTRPIFFARQIGRPISIFFGSNLDRLSS